MRAAQMISEANSRAESLFRSSRDELSAAMVLAALAPHPTKTLVFEYDGHDTLPGYHVTEVKSGAFEAMDCGGNFERWPETYIQLWDVPGGGGRPMSVLKFVGIIGKVTERVSLDPAAKLTFEVSDGARPIQLYKATSIRADKEVVRVHLTQRPAGCKPRDRWLEREKATRCCSTAADQRCCS